MLRVYIFLLCDLKKFENCFLFACKLKSYGEFSYISCAEDESCRGSVMFCRGGCSIYCRGIDAWYAFLYALTKLLHVKKTLNTHQKQKKQIHECASRDTVIVAIDGAAINLIYCQKEYSCHGLTVYVEGSRLEAWQCTGKNSCANSDLECRDGSSCMTRLALI